MRSQKDATSEAFPGSSPSLLYALCEFRVKPSIEKHRRL